MSLINVINNTRDPLVLGLYTTRPTANLKQSAWVTQTLNPAASISVSAKEEYSVHANYGDKLDPDGGQKTDSIPFVENTVKFQVLNASTVEEQRTELEIRQLFEDLVPNQVSLQNMSDQGIWAHIERTVGGSLPPTMMPPGAVLIEDISDMPFYLAILEYLVNSGNKTTGELIDLPATAITSGQTATITGSNWRGYTVTLSE